MAEMLTPAVVIAAAATITATTCWDTGTRRSRHRLITRLRHGGAPHHATATHVTPSMSAKPTPPARPTSDHADDQATETASRGAAHTNRMPARRRARPASTAISSNATPAVSATAAAPDTELGAASLIAAASKPATTAVATATENRGRECTRDPHHAITVPVTATSTAAKNPRSPSVTTIAAITTTARSGGTGARDVDRELDTREHAEGDEHHERRGVGYRRDECRRDQHHGHDESHDDVAHGRSPPPSACQHQLRDERRGNERECRRPPTDLGGQQADRRAVERERDRERVDLEQVLPRAAAGLALQEEHGGGHDQVERGEAHGRGEHGEGEREWRRSGSVADRDERRRRREHRHAAVPRVVDHADVRTLFPVQRVEWPDEQRDRQRTEEDCSVAEADDRREQHRNFRRRRVLARIQRELIDAECDRDREQEHRSGRGNGRAGRDERSSDRERDGKEGEAERSDGSRFAVACALATAVAIPGDGVRRGLGDAFPHVRRPGLRPSGPVAPPGSEQLDVPHGQRPLRELGSRRSIEGPAREHRTHVGKTNEWAACHQFLVEADEVVRRGGLLDPAEQLGPGSGGTLGDEQVTENSFDRLAPSGGGGRPRRRRPRSSPGA